MEERGGRGGRENLISPSSQAEKASGKWGKWSRENQAEVSLLLASPLVLSELLLLL